MRRGPRRPRARRGQQAAATKTVLARGDSPVRSHRPCRWWRRKRPPSRHGPLPLRGNVARLGVDRRRRRRLVPVTIDKACLQRPGRRDGPYDAFDRQIAQFRGGERAPAGPHGGGRRQRRGGEEEQLHARDGSLGGHGHGPCSRRAVHGVNRQAVDGQCRSSKPSGSCKGQSSAAAVSRSKKAAPRQRPSACQA